MIRSITGGAGIHVSGNSYNSPYIDTTRPSSGMLRYINNNIEVYDGSSWLPLQSSYPQIELDNRAMEAVTWAQEQIAKEQRLRELAAQHPTVADALAARERADEAVRIAVALCDTK